MSLVALDGTPLVAVGHANRQGVASLATTSSTLLDATNEACIMIGQVFTEDGSSHTIDTTGSSSLGWRAEAVTFANAGSTLTVGLAAVDTSTGPPGRAVNVTDAITFDVSKALTGGGGGITASSWNEHVPSAGTKTIANGDLVAFGVQMTARAGADAVNVGCASSVTANIRPCVTQFTGAAYSSASQLPNAVITFSDGKLGFFYGSHVLTSQSTQVWNNGSATKEYGNYLLMPVPAKIYGIIACNDVAGDCDFILYSDPLGTPVAEKTVSVDLNTIGASVANNYLPLLFSSPYSSAPRQPLAAIMKPTSVTSVTSRFITLSNSAHQKSMTLGANGYAVNRASGAFAAQNSNKDRFAIGLLVGAFEHGVQPTYQIGI